MQRHYFLVEEKVFGQLCNKQRPTRCDPKPYCSRYPKQVKALEISAAEWTFCWILDWSFSRNMSKQIKYKCMLSRGSLFDYQRAGKTLGVAEQI